MGEKKKYVLKLFLIIVVLCLVGLIICFVINKKDNNKIPEETKKYNNYISKELEDVANDEKLNIKIENGNLNISSESINITSTGLDENNIKSFTYGYGCSNEIAILVITNDNDVYIGHYYPNDPKNLKNLTFKKIETQEKIVDITTHVDTGHNTCSGSNLAVVLENGEIRSVDLEKYTIGTIDYRDFIYRMGNTMIYKEQTISSADQWDKTNKNLIKTNNINLKVKKVYSGYDNNLNNVEYVVSDNNKLYKITTVYDNSHNIKSSSATLLSNKKVIKTSTTKIGYNEFEGMNLAETITFEDGTTTTLKNIDSAYIIK